MEKLSKSLIQIKYSPFPILVSSHCAKELEYFSLSDKNKPTIIELCQVVPSANLTTLWHFVVPCWVH